MILPTTVQVVYNPHTDKNEVILSNNHNKVFLIQGGFPNRPSAEIVAKQFAFDFSIPYNERIRTR